MANYSDRIKPIDYGIHTYLENLLKRNYQIPTFQRNVVWDEQNVKKLWDSIYKFYPMGSILIWKTDIKLQNHRSIGGHIIQNEDISEYQYILDGQQRTTALLTSLYGGKIEGKDDFDPTIYVDLTIQDENDTDDESYNQRFLFWYEIDDRNGTYLRNKSRMEKYKKGLIVKLQDIKHNYEEVEEKLIELGLKYKDGERRRLRKIRSVLDNYRISFIELKGIQVAQVCQIFERINQEGKPLDIFDIVVAKTFRPESKEAKGFYLRELIDNFRKECDGNFKDIDDLTYLQIIATIINQNIEDSRIYNITERYLGEIKTEQIEQVWEETKKAILKLFDFFDNHLHLKGPALIPFRYFYMVLASYFYENIKPDYDLLKKYFWFYSFHNDELLRNTTHLWEHVGFLNRAKKGEDVKFPKFIIDKNVIRTSSYHSRSRISRAILSLFAYQEPRDWQYHDRHVLSEVYYILTDHPNLHHIFPVNFIDTNRNYGENVNSLMNIAYLTQITNLQISDQNPINYLKKYNGSTFEEVLKSHLIPLKILEWSRKSKLPSNALDDFIEMRTEIILQKLKSYLSGIDIEVIDTK